MQTLYDKSKSGKIKIWKISVRTNSDNHGIIDITHGYEDGKMTTKSKVITQGKNLGKSNETTAYGQALSEAKSKWQKQKDKGYVTDKKDIGSQPQYFPMLAKRYSEKSSKIDFPIYVQPKLNGVRCIAVKSNNEVKLYSRKMKQYTDVCSNLVSNLNKVMYDGSIFDGEIYKHGWSLQRIVAAVKKKSSDTNLLEYHRYDIPSHKDTFTERNRAMLMYCKTNQVVKQVVSHLVNSKAVIKEMHDYYVDLGYEGLIIRKQNGEYEWKHRSSSLLKYKEFIDEECRIIGYKSSTGATDRAIIWKVRRRNSSGHYVYFDVVPRGTLEDRIRLYPNGWKYIGKMLTVRYHSLSDEERPIPNPVGIAIRDYE